MSLHLSPRVEASDPDYPPQASHSKTAPAASWSVARALAALGAAAALWLPACSNIGCDPPVERLSGAMMPVKPPTPQPEAVPEPPKPTEWVVPQPAEPPPPQDHVRLAGRQPAPRLR